MMSYPSKVPVKETVIDEKTITVKKSVMLRAAVCRAVDGDKADADYSDGMLRVTIPKAAVAQKKTIKVSTK